MSPNSRSNAAPPIGAAAVSTTAAMSIPAARIERSAVNDSRTYQHDNASRIQYAKPFQQPLRRRDAEHAGRSAGEGESHVAPPGRDNPCWQPA